jgi:hypothetical protein
MYVYMFGKALNVVFQNNSANKIWNVCTALHEQNI